MEKPSEIAKEIQEVLSFLEKQSLSPGRKISILRGAADIIQQIMNTEYQIVSLRAIIDKTLNNMDK